MWRCFNDMFLFLNFYMDKNIYFQKKKKRSNSINETTVQKEVCEILYFGVSKDKHTLHDGVVRD